MRFEDARVVQWCSDMHVIEGEILQLAHVDDVFWQVQAIIQANPAIPDSEVAAEWFGRMYVSTVSAGLRRLVDRTKGSVSLTRLLDDMSRHCTVLTRERYVAINRSVSEADASEWFVELAGTDLGHIPRKRILELAARLSDAFESTGRFANEYVAHHSADQSASVTFGETRRALVEAYLVLGWCSRVLESVVHSNAVPAIQTDWLQAFTVPWLPSQNPVPGYRHLDSLVDEARRERPV